MSNYEAVPFEQYVFNGIVLIPNGTLKCCCCNILLQNNNIDLMEHITSVDHHEAKECVQDIDNSNFVDELVCTKLVENNITVSLPSLQSCLHEKTRRFKSFCFRCQMSIGDGINGLEDHYKKQRHENFKYRQLQHYCVTCNIFVANLQAHMKGRFHLDVEKDNNTFGIEITSMPIKKLVVKNMPWRFEHFFHYRQIMGPLIKSEEDSQQKYTRSLQMLDVKIRWEGKAGLEERPKAFFQQKVNDDEYFKLKLGDEMVIFYKSEWSMGGYIVKIPDIINTEVCIELKNGVGLKKDRIEQHTIKPKFRRTVYHRMWCAVRDLGNNLEHFHWLMPYLLNHDLNPTVEKEVQISENQLNAAQIQAVKMALLNDLVLIQGPPGTGKTVTSAQIIFELQKRQKKVLVCAQSNVAVDHLAQKLDEKGLECIRLFSEHCDVERSPVKHLSPKEYVLNHNVDLRKEYQKYIKKEMNKEEEDKFETKISLEMEQALHSVKIVCCTCISAGKPSFVKDNEFDVVLIDEAAQATEPECLVPVVMHKAKKLILVGDHKQLGPVVLSQEASEAGFSRSLFERLINKKNVPSIMLNVQYRMHKSIAILPSQMFYDNKLITGDIERNLEFKFTIKKPRAAITFYNIDGSEETLGTSFFNDAEVKKVVALVKKIVDEGIDTREIGIITPYDAQRRKVFSEFALEPKSVLLNLLNIEVANVDGFQGREKDIIILTCVRSNNSLTEQIGFLKESRRMNVALTRAREKLFIIGNQKTLMKNEKYTTILSYVNDL